MSSEPLGISTSEAGITSISAYGIWLLTGMEELFLSKHLQKYVDEFVARQNFRNQDTIDQMTTVVRSMEGK